MKKRGEHSHNSGGLQGEWVYQCWYGCEYSRRLQRNKLEGGRKYSQLYNNQSYRNGKKTPIAPRGICRKRAYKHSHTPHSAGRKWRKPECDTGCSKKYEGVFVGWIEPYHRYPSCVLICITGSFTAKKREVNKSAFQWRMETGVRYSNKKVGAK